MIARCEPPPQRVPIAEKTECLCGLIVDIDRNIFPIKRTDEAVALSGFYQMIGKHLTLYWREQNAGIVVFCDKTIRCLGERSADVLT